MHKSFWDNNYYSLGHMVMCIIAFIAIFLMQAALYNHKCVEVNRLKSQNQLLLIKIEALENMNK